VVRTLGTVLTALTLLAAGLAGPASVSAAERRPLPSYFALDADVQQLVTVTSRRWNNTRASMTAWRKRGGEWHRVRGPVRVRLGYNGWVPAGKRRQSTGTTPAGSFAMKYAFGNRRDPGAELRYQHADRNDIWPYEPRDPETYNIWQPFRAKGSHWRRGYSERLASYGREYAYGVVLDFNLPGGVHWSQERKQYVARRPADVRRGGGIFLHVQGSRFTAGCVAGPLRDIRWIVRWLDPDLRPRIVMGPTRFVKHRF
jgi:L,D-peptidoglycan transpeptidase YkuD (ErfK/YbiS/YcfS/YnhG family)